MSHRPTPTTIVSLRMPVALHADLGAAAERTNHTVSSLLRSAANRHLERLDDRRRMVGDFAPDPDPGRDAATPQRHSDTN